MKRTIPIFQTNQAESTTKRRNYEKHNVSAKGQEFHHCCPVGGFRCSRTNRSVRGKQVDCAG
jgi:hypothetical protein